MVTREKQQKTGLLCRFSAVFDGILCDYKTRFRVYRLTKDIREIFLELGIENPDEDIPAIVSRLKIRL